MTERDLYTRTLTREEIDKYVGDAQTVVDRVKKDPYGKGLVRPLIRRLMGHIDPGANRELAEASGSLLPLFHQEVVRNDPDLHGRLADIQDGVMFFSARFRNSGVKLVVPPK